MKQIILISLLLFFFTPKTIFSQNYFENKIECLGPFSLPEGGLHSAGVGAVSCIKVNPKNHEQIYIGTICGGFWKTENSGKNWKCMSDNILAGGNKFSVHPDNFDIIYINSALRVINGSSLRNIPWGEGAFVSENGGENWEKLPISNSSENYYIANIKIDIRNPEKIYAVGDNFFYFSNDKGKTFKTYEFDFDENTFFLEIDLVPDSSGYVFLSGRNIFWKINPQTGKYTDLQDISSRHKEKFIVSTTMHNDTVYSMQSGKNGASKIRFSDDAGKTWQDTVKRSFSGRLYIQTFEISPEGYFYAGGIYLYRLTDKKTNRYRNISGNLHPDIRTIHFPDSANDSLVYVGTDGGISKSENGGKTWENISGDLCSSLFLGVAINEKSPDLFIGGTGDCGTLMHKPDRKWYAVYGCDGGSSMIDYNDTTNVWITCNGTLKLSQRSGRKGTFRNFKYSKDIPFYDPALVQHPYKPDVFYVGEWSLSEYTDKGETRIGRVWLNDFPKIGSGGLITAVAISKCNADYIYFAYAGLDNQKPDYPTVWRAENGIGGKYHNITKGLNLSKSTKIETKLKTRISGIALHPDDTLKLWVSVNQFSEGNKVFYSKNGGDKWKNISYNLPNIPINCILFNKKNNTLYIGTDTGLFRLEKKSETWEKLKFFPVTVVSELKLNSITNELFIATYGRGIWKMML